MLGAGRDWRGCCASTCPTSAVISANVTLIAAKTKPVSNLETPVNLIVMETFLLFAFEEQKYQLVTREGSNVPRHVELHGCGNAQLHTLQNCLKPLSEH